MLHRAVKVYGAAQCNNNIAAGAVSQYLRNGFINAAGGMPEFHNGATCTTNQAGGNIVQQLFADVTNIACSMVKAFPEQTLSNNTITLTTALTAAEKTWCLTPAGGAAAATIGLPASIGNRNITAIDGTNKIITFDGATVATITGIPAGNVTISSKAGTTRLFINGGNAQTALRLMALKTRNTVSFLDGNGLTSTHRVSNAVADATAVGGIWLDLNAVTTAATNGNVTLLDAVPGKLYAPYTFARW